jgi:uncharacterized protein YndB with AHSA1/START domain
MECAHVEVNLEKEGSFVFCFQADEGKEFGGRGTYEEIESPKYLSYKAIFVDKMGILCLLIIIDCQVTKSKNY